MMVMMHDGGSKKQASHNSYGSELLERAFCYCVIYPREKLFVIKILITQTNISSA